MTMPRQEHLSYGAGQDDFQDGFELVTGSYPAGKDYAAPFSPEGEGPLSVYSGHAFAGRGSAGDADLEPPVSVQPHPPHAAVHEPSSAIPPRRLRPLEAVSGGERSTSSERRRLAAQAEYSEASDWTQIRSVDGWEHSPNCCQPAGRPRRRSCRRPAAPGRRRDPRQRPESP